MSRKPLFPRIARLKEMETLYLWQIILPSTRQPCFDDDNGGVVQKGSQPRCKNCRLCFALIGCIVNSSPLGSKQYHHAKPQNIPLDPYSDDSIWPTQGHKCCSTSPYIYSECDSLCRLPRGDCKTLGDDIETRSLVTLNAMARPNPKITKRARKGGPRGKTGCSTCRARHVKCDERKPSCSKCTSTGRKCDGYERAEASGPQKLLLLHERARSCTSRTSPLNDSPVSLALTLGLPANEQSNRFFHSFLHGCVPSLIEVMDSEFWQRSVVRASSSPVVQYAAIAFGAVYEQQMAHQNHHVGLTLSSHGQKLELLSSTRYEAAIQILRHRIAEVSQASEGLEEILIACLIFVFMEVLRGDDIAAVTHLDGAFKLYTCAEPSAQAIISTRDNNDASSISFAFEGFVKIFLRLETQSVQYMGSRTPWYPDSTYAWPHTSEDIPAMFETFLDARDNFYAHVAKIMDFTTPPEGAEKCFPEWCPHPDRGFDIYTIFHGSTYRDYILPRASTQRRHLMHVLSRWKSGFQGFLQKGTAKTPEALASCALLWLEYYTIRIKLAVSYTEDECCYDAQLPSFEKIVEQAEAYLRYTANTSRSQLPRDLSGNHSTMPSLKPKKKDFKVYSSVCYPLYYTVLKCRYKPLRQSALAMLRNANTEGVWDANMLARIGEFVTAVEENSIAPDSGDACVDTPNYGVPEMNRIHCLSLNVVKSQRTVWLRYSRRAIKTQEEISNGSIPSKRWRIGSTILTWKDTTAECVAEIVGTEEFATDLPPSTNPSWENQTLAYRSPQPQC